MTVCSCFDCRELNFCPSSLIEQQEEEIVRLKAENQRLKDAAKVLVDALHELKIWCSSENGMVCDAIDAELKQYKEMVGE